MQEINEELIHKFFSGLCTQEEAALVLLYLKQHPDHPFLLQEWEETDGVTSLPAFYSEEMRQVVIRQTDPSPVRKLAARWSLAVACILAVVFLAWWGIKKDPALPALVRKGRPQTDWISQRNNSAEQLVVMLEDSSRITLSPGASIRYRKGFGIARPRDVYMQGDVFFEVAKNKARPFTVYSGYISTTALGTAFRVTAPEKKQQIKVRLNEGKVVVALTGYPAAKPPAYYLVPGQELVFHARDKPGILHSFFVKVAAKKSWPITGQQQNRTESYLFNNQTLPDVLDQLSVIYGVRFRYSQADLCRIYFVGKVERSESIEKTLEDIALLNRLSVTKEKKGFILESKK